MKTFESSHRLPYAAALPVAALSEAQLRQLWTDVRNNTSAFAVFSNLRQSETDKINHYGIQQILETGESAAPASPTRRRGLTPQLRRQSSQSKADHGARSHDRRIQYSTAKKRYQSTRRVSFSEQKTKSDLLSPKSPSNLRLSFEGLIKFDAIAGPSYKIVDVDAKVRSHFESITKQLKQANQKRRQAPKGANRATPKVEADEQIGNASAERQREQMFDDRADRIICAKPALKYEEVEWTGAELRKQQTRQKETQPRFVCQEAQGEGLTSAKLIALALHECKPGEGLYSSHLASSGLSEQQLVSMREHEPSVCA